jgi:hypothetical protein
MEEKPIDSYIREIIEESIEKHDWGIKKEDAQQIIEILVPTIDKMISHRIKQHLRFLATNLIDSLTP